MAQSESMPILAVLLLASVSLALPSTSFGQQPVSPGPQGSVAAAPDANKSKPGTGDATASDQAKADQAKTDQAKGDAGATKQDDSKAKSPQDQRQADREAFFSARIAALHAGLTLTDDQESLWAPVEAAIRELAKTRGGRGDRNQVAKLLQETPSDLVRMRSAQLIQRGEAMKKLVDATGPLLDRLSDTQKNRLPLLLEGLRPSIILRAAFDIRYGRVVNDPDDNDPRSKHQDQRGDQGSDTSDQDGGSTYHRNGMMQERGRGEEDHGYQGGRQDPMPRHHSGQDDDDRT